MTKHSLYVRTNHTNPTSLYCTVQNISLPIDASDELLSHNRMLSGQEDEALLHKLLNPKGIRLTIIPTWGCNLRCKHCVVINELEKGNDSELDIPRLIEFIDLFGGYHPSKQIFFVGGEPLLRPDIVKNVIDSLPSCAFSMTTNLSMDLTELHCEVVEKCNSIIVSVDGLPKNHNSQRISLNKEPDLFGKTVENIKTFIRRGSKHIAVQAAVKQYDYEEQDIFTHFFCNIGIDPSMITYGLIHPHPRGPSSSAFEAALKRMPLTRNPCCKYQPGAQCVILPDNSIVSDFYSRIPIGTIYDDPKDVIDNHKRLVLDTMPAYNDPVCRKCDVLGYCWGHCSNGEPLTGQNPSKYCDQANLQKLVSKLALAGALAPNGLTTCLP